MRTTTTMKTIKSFNVTWTADHEQYFQGHGIACSDWTHCAVGVGETLREAFDDAIEQLIEQGIDVETIVTLDNEIDEVPEAAMLAELQSQFKEPNMIDWDTVLVYCECENCPACKENADGWREHECAVCAGEWHYYVMIDMKVADRADESEADHESK